MRLTQRDGWRSTESFLAPLSESDLCYRQTQKAKQQREECGGGALETVQAYLRYSLLWSKSRCFGHFQPSSHIRNEQPKEKHPCFNMNRRHLIFEYVLCEIIQVKGVSGGRSVF